MLDIRGLDVRYGDTIAVHGVDLHVERGEIVALLGPSGCGKSTILRAVAGLVAPSAGRVLLDGRDMTDVPAHRRDVGLMFQDYALFPHRDVAGNVAFGPRMQGMRGTVLNERVEEALRLVGLAGFESRSVASLSGGEQQRVALARALAPSPALLLLDEPLGSLDRSLRERLASELRELFVRLGLTAVTVTHDQEEAFTLADRVVLLRDGAVVQVGTPIAVWQRPVDELVARFLGFGNVFAVEVVDRAVDSPWGPIPSDRSDGPAALVIRPDGLRLVAAAGGVTGTVGAVTFRGDHFRVSVEVDGRRYVVVERQAAPAPGDRVHVALERDAALVLGRG